MNKTKHFQLNATLQENGLMQIEMAEGSNFNNAEILSTMACFAQMSVENKSELEELKQMFSMMVDDIYTQRKVQESSNIVPMNQKAN